MARKGQSAAFLKALRKKHGLGEFKRRKSKRKRKTTVTKRRSPRRKRKMKLYSL